MEPGPRARSNDRAVLQVLEDRPQLTRQQIVEATGLSRSTVADVVARMVSAGRLAESPSAPAGRGRPAQVLRLADPQGLLLGLAFGHNNLAVAVGDPSGQILRERAVDASVDHDPLKTLDLALQVSRELLQEEGSDLDDVAHVAAGMPGPLDHEGVLQIPSLLGNGQIMEPAKALRELFGRPVLTVNDTVLGAYGEMQVGAARGVDTFIFVKASHGVGAALIVGGKLHRGSTGLAGEIGHTRLSGATGRCRCGNVGCLETMSGIEGLARELPAPYGQDSLCRPSVGDPVVDRVITDAGRSVGATLAPICNLLNPSLIVTGGLLGSGHAEAFVKGMREGIDGSTQPAIARAVDVVPSALGIRVERVGAVLLARREALAASSQL
ncbi:hypothetical protein BJF81_13490 [Ornithinimicrobium sp. CNJ-824]|nr:hypothetical protein BJF81_13490 [Ornithinimicrobium sp. CNJ-824]